MTIMITKTDAAERQLNTAIRLFFENRDHLSSYALAVASREITDAVIQSQYGELGIQSQYGELYRRELARVGDPLKVHLSHREELKLLIKPEFYMSFLTLYHKWQNFLKHADKDPNAEIEPFTTKVLALVIILAIRNYIVLTQNWTIEMRTFFAWFVVAEPQFIESAPENLMTEAIAEMRSNISFDPYDRNTLEAIYTAMTDV
jgi:hypothetical protein